MNSEKATAKRKPESNNGSCMGISVEEEVAHHPSTTDDSPNLLLYRKVCIFRIIMEIPRINSK